MPCSPSSPTNHAGCASPGSCPAETSSTRSPARRPTATTAPRNANRTAIALLAQAAHLTPAHGPLIVGCKWTEADRRRDPDNIVSGGRKLILDAIGPGRRGGRGWHGAGVIHCDGWHCIALLVDVFEIGKPGVEVVIAEVQLTLPLLERREVAIDLRAGTS